MFALTVCEGWATAIFESGKDVENRNWPTPQRGKIIIHAGKSKKELEASRAYHAMLGIPFPETLNYGHAIGTVEIIGCKQGYLSRWSAEGQWQFILTNPTKFTQPIACKGQLGFWKFPDGLIGA